MKSRMTKLAAGVMIIAIALSGVMFFNGTTSTAWAIDDTIRALENICALKMSGTVSGVNENGEFVEGDFVLWAKANSDGTTSEELCLEAPSETTVVTASGTTYRYYPRRNTVKILEDGTRPTIDPWIGSKFFQDLRRFAEDWKVSYGPDEETGRECIFVTCVCAPMSRSWWFQFDCETKQPVRFKQWTNINFVGQPEFYAESIEYNPQLPEGTFEFEIPEGAEVEKVAWKMPEYFDDPNVGMSAQGLTDEQACLAIIEDYWRALIDGDWEYLAQLRPILNAGKWQFKYKANDNWPVELLAVDAPLEQEGCSIGPVVPCRVKYSDGQIKNIEVIVRIRTLGGMRSCVIAGTYGGTKDFER